MSNYNSRYTISRDRLADLRVQEKKKLFLYFISYNSIIGCFRQVFINNHLTWYVNTDISLNSTDAFGPTRAPGRQVYSSNTNNDSQESSYEMETKSTNHVVPAAQSDISTMDGYLTEVSYILF